jgi:aspartate oxidase
LHSFITTNWCTVGNARATSAVHAANCWISALSPHPSGSVDGRQRLAFVKTCEWSGKRSSSTVTPFIAASASARKESRGGHYREDYPNRDDVNFMRHTMAYREVGDDGTESIRLDYKPVVQTRYQPMERKY